MFLLNGCSSINLDKEKITDIFSLDDENQILSPENSIQFTCDQNQIFFLRYLEDKNAVWMEDGRLRQFNLSCLITKEFMEAVKNDGDWKLAFPLTEKEAKEDKIDLKDKDQVVWREWPVHGKYLTENKGKNAGKVACKVYKILKAKRLWDIIMSSTYDYARIKQRKN